VLNQKTEEAFSQFLEAFFRRKVVVTFLSHEDVMAQHRYNPDDLWWFLGDDSQNDLEDLYILSMFLKNFKEDKKELKENNFTLVEFGNEICVRRQKRKDIEIFSILVEKIKKNFRKYSGKEKHAYVNPNQPIKISLLSSTFEKMVIHNSKKLKIVHELLEYLDAFVANNLPYTDNERIKRKVTLNLTGYFLLKELDELDVLIEKYSLNIENILQVILQPDT
jgi:hypothetical protein